MAHVRVKICGITNEADVSAAVELGADALGLNFYPPSPRHVDLETAARILRGLPPFVEPVAVVVDRSREEMASLLAALAGIRAVQWHGEAPDAAHPEFFRLIAAFGVAEPVDVVRMGAYLRACRERGHTPAAVLVDARVAGLHGGTGRPAPWHLLADFTPGVPLILAGGLTPENVAEAIRIVRPFAVDVTSGVEAGPGRKDREKMRRFLDVVRSL